MALEVRVKRKISDMAYLVLNAPVALMEIEKVVLFANISKASGVNRFNAGFFRAYWDTIK